MHSSWYSDFGLWWFLILPKLYVSAPLSYSQKVSIIVFLSPNVKYLDVKILCCDLAEKIGMAQKGLQLA